MNNISSNLIEAPDEFEPMFMEREVKGKTYCIVDEWCDGYLRGMKLDSKGWSTTENIEPLLSSLLLFSSEAGWEKLEQMTDKEIEHNKTRLLLLCGACMHGGWNTAQTRVQPIVIM